MQLEGRLKQIEAEASAITAATDAAAADYAAARERLATARRQLLRYVQRPDHSLHFLRPGRIVRVTEGATDWG